MSINKKKSIHVVDFSDYKKDPKKFALNFVMGLHYNGFVVLRNHGLNVGMLDGALEKFQTCLENKKDRDALNICDRTHKLSLSYNGQDRKYRHKSPRSLFNHLSIAHYEMTRLTAVLLEVIAEHIGLKKDYFSKQASDSDSILRALHYKGETQNNRHTDFSLLTVLYSQDDGLYMAHEHGDIHLNMHKKDLIINSGRALALLTNNYFKPHPHMTDVKMDQVRNSLVFFVNLNGDFLLDVLPQYKSYRGKINNEKWFCSVSELPVRYADFVNDRIKDEYSNQAKTYRMYKK